MKKLSLLTAAALLLSLGQSPAQAAAFSQIYVYGDSLSDVGRVFDDTSGAWPPYAGIAGDGRFSNGPVWVEYLATQLGLSSDFSNNFAKGGATTGTFNFLTSMFPTVTGGLQNQIIDNPFNDPDALYIIWAGATDYISGVDNPAIPVGQITNAINLLTANNAQNLLVVNLANLGNIPAITDPAQVAGLNALTQSHNALLNDAIASTQAAIPSLNLYTLDVNSLFNQIVADPAAFGFSNITDACITFSACADPNSYLYWDIFDLSTKGHQLIANAAINTLGVPEPLTLLGASTAIAIGVSLKRQRNLN